MFVKLSWEYVFQLRMGTFSAVLEKRTDSTKLWVSLLQQCFLILN